MFTPGTPLASDAGMEVLTGPRDHERSRRALKEAGYNNERVALIVPTDFPNLKAMADVGADLLKRIGMNVDYQATDWGTLVSRRAKKDPVDQGGWSAFFTFGAGVDQASPAANLMLRANGANAWFGWPDDPKIERLRDAWFAACAAENRRLNRAERRAGERKEATARRRAGKRARRPEAAPAVAAAPLAPPGPRRWVQNFKPTELFDGPNPGARGLDTAAQFSTFELLEDPSGPRAKLFDHGQGAGRMPSTVWANAGDIGPSGPPNPEFELPLGGGLDRTSGKKAPERVGSGWPRNPSAEAAVVVAPGPGALSG